MVEEQEPQPRRVIQETTAATMRRMMEGVVLGGTGKLAQLDGYTTAGKTGTAQKFDMATGHYSAHDLIASFVGFAPINTPAVTILVQLDSPVGMHEGGQVAAPTFKRVAQQVLAYLDVPHDIPVSDRKSLRSGRRPAGDQSLADASDFDPVQVDSNAPSVKFRLRWRPRNPQAELQPQRWNWRTEMEFLSRSWQGKTVREAIEECMKLGLTPVLVGTGIAVEQSPDPGVMIRRGSRITIQFARDASLVSAAARGRVR